MLVTDLSRGRGIRHDASVTDALIRAAQRPSKHIDDSSITWRPFSGYDGLYFWVLGVNEIRQQVDLYFRLAPGARCPSHRHVGPTDTLVVRIDQFLTAADARCKVHKGLVLLVPHG